MIGVLKRLISSARVFLVGLPVFSSIFVIFLSVRNVFLSRAVDNQCYVAAVSPARDQQADYVAYGHSLLVDPW